MFAVNTLVLKEKDIGSIMTTEFGISAINMFVQINVRIIWNPLNIEANKMDTLNWGQLFQASRSCGEVEWPCVNGWGSCGQSVNESWCACEDCNFPLKETIMKKFIYVFVIIDVLDVIFLFNHLIRIELAFFVGLICFIISIIYFVMFDFFW